jgi:hypothetical protein
MVNVEKIRTGKNGIKEEMGQSYKYMSGGENTKSEKKYEL